MRDRAEKRSKRIKYILLPFLIIAMILLLRYGLHELGRGLFSIRKVEFIGNKHLSEKELKTLSGITEKHISTKSIRENLMKSPWIRDVSIRIDLPETLKIRIGETEPFALLEIKGRPFLIDDNGRLLEELRGEAVPFLPVILADPYKNRESFTEALNLAKVLKAREIAKERNRVEIIANKEKEDISVVIDGVVIKVGYGKYEEKFERLLELEEEIKKRAMAVEYIDLRFSDNVIVKPVKEVVR